MTAVNNTEIDLKQSFQRSAFGFDAHNMDARAEQEQTAEILNRISDIDGVKTMRVNTPDNLTEPAPESPRQEVHGMLIPQN